MLEVGKHFSLQGLQKSCCNCHSERSAVIDLLLAARGCYSIALFVGLGKTMRLQERAWDDSQLMLCQQQGANQWSYSS